MGVRQLGVAEAHLCDHAPEVGVGIIELLDDIDHFPIVEPEAGKPFIGFKVRQLVHEPVVSLPEPEHQAVLFAVLLDRNYDGVAVFPFPDHVGDHFRRVLQIGHQPNDRVAFRLMKSVHGRANVPEVAGVDDDLNVLINGRDGFENGNRVIGRSVVDEDVLVLVPANRRHDTADALIQLRHIRFLVVTGGQNTDRLHGSHRPISARSTLPFTLARVTVGTTQEFARLWSRFSSCAS